MKDARERIKVVVIKEGEARELYNLPTEILTRLDEAYEKAPVKGLSHETYVTLAEFFAGRLAAYERELMNGTDRNEMFKKSVAFAKAFDISSEESPALFDLMLHIERRVGESGSAFDVREVCIKNLKEILNMSWSQANRDFRKWARKLFESTGLKIGVIRMAKFYFGVTTQLA